MENVPFYVYATFLVTLLLTLYFFYRATPRGVRFLLVAALWLLLQSGFSLLGLYAINGISAPKTPLLLVPPLLAILALFSTAAGRRWIKSLSPRWLTLLHVVRIPVELVLFWLFLYKTVPQSMTFEGRNFDIVSGLTAPFIYYFGYFRNRLSRTVLLGWNLGCLGLLINIAFIAVRAVPRGTFMAGSPPNIAVLHFPFLFLPAVIVPLVLFAHVATIRQLIFSSFSNNKLSSI